MSRNVSHPPPGISRHAWRNVMLIDRLTSRCHAWHSWLTLYEVTCSYTECKLALCAAFWYSSTSGWDFIALWQWHNFCLVLEDVPKVLCHAVALSSFSFTVCKDIRGVRFVLHQEYFFCHLVLKTQALQFALFVCLSVLRQWESLLSSTAYL